MKHVQFDTSSKRKSEKLESKRNGKKCFLFANYFLLVHQFSRVVKYLFTLDCGVDGNDNVGDSGLMSP